MSRHPILKRSRQSGYRQLTLAMVLAIACISAPRAFGTPNLINYQGRLTTSTGTAVVDSTWTVTFAVYGDPVSGSSLWNESATVATVNGQFTHLLGSVTTIPPTLFTSAQPRWLALTVSGEELLPRTRLASVPYARTSGSLAVHDSRDSLVIVTSADTQSVELRNDQGKPAVRLNGTLFGAITLFDESGKVGITLRADTTGDKAVVLPDSSISSQEMLDEPAIAVNFGVDLVPLSTLTMTDLVTVEITTPADGFLILHGKCYVLLSGTTGANTAIIQIDTDPGGSSQFPWYSQVGLSGYVNTQTNYFPVYTTRAYFAEKGTYEFRMEGRANNFSPASAASWDHVVTAIFYPTAMDAVAATVSSPAGFTNAVPLHVDTLRPNIAPVFKVDLRDKLREK
jgi:hypothetical protein